MNNYISILFPDTNQVPKCPHCYKAQKVIGDLPDGLHHKINNVCENCGDRFKYPICSVPNCTRTCDISYQNNILGYYNVCKTKNCGKRETSPYGCAYPDCSKPIYLDLETGLFEPVCDEHKNDPFFKCAKEGCEDMASHNGSCFGTYCHYHG